VINTDFWNAFYMERLINSDCWVTQLWSPVTLRKSEEEGYMFSETSEIELHVTKSKKASIIDTAVKAPQKTVLFHH
jgi:hypothetical protein